MTQPDLYRELGDYLDGIFPDGGGGPSFFGPGTLPQRPVQALRRVTRFIASSRRSNLAAFEGPMVSSEKNCPKRIMTPCSTSARHGANGGMRGTNSQNERNSGEAERSLNDLGER